MSRLGPPLYVPVRPLPRTGVPAKSESLALKPTLVSFGDYCLHQTHRMSEDAGGPAPEGDDERSVALWERGVSAAAGVFVVCVVFGAVAGVGLMVWRILSDVSWGAISAAGVVFLFGMTLAAVVIRHRWPEHWNTLFFRPSRSAEISRVLAEMSRRRGGSEE